MTVHALAAGLAVLAAVISGCSGSHRATSTPSSSAPHRGDTEWEMLEGRPLTLPSISAGDRCPVTTTVVHPAGVAPAVGDGPLYAVGVSSPEGAALVSGRGQAGWRAGKVLWVSDPSHPGPWLVRGRRLDADGEVRFGLGLKPSPSLRLPRGGTATSPGLTWFAWPSAVRTRDPGCYAFQLDFIADAQPASTRIVFRA